jgi:uncharacterized Zn finger protein (UPF0148 family)
LRHVRAESGQGFLLSTEYSPGGKVIDYGTGLRLVRMELKYCECCGGLLLRRSGEIVTYCSGCEKKLAELAAPAAGVSGVTAATKRSEEPHAKCAMGSTSASTAQPPKKLPQGVVAVNAAGDRRRA